MRSLRCDTARVAARLRRDHSQAFIIAKPSSSSILHENRLVIDALGIGHSYKTARACFRVGTSPSDLVSV